MHDDDLSIIGVWIVRLAAVVAAVLVSAASAGIAVRVFSAIAGW
jgi:hypothetical protein